MICWQYGGVVARTEQSSGSAESLLELPLLIYDGDCAFCSSSVRFIERRLRRHPRCQPWQWLDLETYGVSRDDCERAVQFVDADGRVHSAERAIARTFVHAGAGWAILGNALLIPGVRHLAGVVYRWVSANRHRMPGGTPQCSLPADRRHQGAASAEES